MLYQLAHTRKILVDIFVEQPQDTIAARFQIMRAPLIMHQGVRFIMLGTIKFDNQFSLRTKKICNILTYCPLAIEPGTIMAKKIIPQMALFSSHVVP